MYRIEKFADGNTIIQTVSKTLVEVNAKLMDKRDPAKGPETYTLFFELDEDENYIDRIREITKEMGFTVYAMMDPMRTTFTYDTGVTFVNLWSKEKKK